MKNKLFIVVLAAILSLSVCGCTTAESSSVTQTTSATGTTATNAVASTDTAAATVTLQTQTASFDTSGISQTLSLMGTKSAQSVVYRQCLLRLEYEGNELAEYNINVDTVYGIAFALADIDGDALPEIVVQIDMGGNGGMGSYTQCVLKYDAAHKSFLELLKIDVPIDTGFTALFQNNYKMNVINTYADYSRIVDVSQDDRDSYYNADGTYIREKADILLDTCYYFYPEDVNSDGTAEIKTLQYVSLNSRSDCVGLATTTLKYDTVESKFVVIEAAFNLPNEMPMDSVLTPFYGYPGAYPNIQ